MYFNDLLVTCVKAGDNLFIFLFNAATLTLLEDNYQVFTGFVNL